MDEQKIIYQENDAVCITYKQDKIELLSEKINNIEKDISEIYDMIHSINDILDKSSLCETYEEDEED